MYNFSSFVFVVSCGVELFGICEDDWMFFYLLLCYVVEWMFVEMGLFYGGIMVFFVESLDIFVEDMKCVWLILLFGVLCIWIKF